MSITTVSLSRSVAPAALSSNLSSVSANPGVFSQYILTGFVISGYVGAVNSRIALAAVLAEVHDCVPTPMERPVVTNVNRAASFDVPWV